MRKDRIQLNSDYVNVFNNYNKFIVSFVENNPLRKSKQIN